MNFGITKKLNKQFLVMSIGTDIGKTYFIKNSCLKNKNIFAIKPIISGFDYKEPSDSSIILSAMGLKETIDNFDLISPWRFKKAASPHIAASKDIEFNEVIKFCKKHIKKSNQQNKTLLIEAAGGVMTPINHNKTFIDLAQELKIPVILITANFLGSISHTLCSIESLKKFNIKIENVIVNNIIPSHYNDSQISNKDFATYIKNYSNINIEYL